MDNKSFEQRVCLSLDIFLESFDPKDKAFTKWGKGDSSFQSFNGLFKKLLALNWSSAQELKKLSLRLFQCSSSSQLEHQLFPNLLEAQKASGLFVSLFFSHLFILKHNYKAEVLYSMGSYFFKCPSGRFINLSNCKENYLDDGMAFEILRDDNSQKFNFVDLCKHYYSILCDSFLEQKLLLSLKRAQSFILQLDPLDTKWLARRALTNKRIGLYSEALADIKRFLSFCPEELAPPAIKDALIDLQGLDAIDNFNNYSLH